MEPIPGAYVGEGWERVGGGRGFMVIRVKKMVRISTSLAFVGKVGLGLRQVVIRMRKCSKGKSDKQGNRRALQEDREQLAMNNEDQQMQTGKWSQVVGNGAQITQASST